MWKPLDFILVVTLGTIGTAFAYSDMMTPPEIDVKEYPGRIEFVKNKQIWQYSKMGQNKYLDIRLFGNNGNDFEQYDKYHIAISLPTSILVYTSRLLANKVYREKLCEADVANSATMQFALTANPESFAKLKSMRNSFLKPNRECAKIVAQELSLISYGDVGTTRMQTPEKVRASMSGSLDPTQLLYISKVEEIDCNQVK